MSTFRGEANALRPSSEAPADDRPRTYNSVSGGRVLNRPYCDGAEHINTEDIRIMLPSSSDTGLVESIKIMSSVQGCTAFTPVMHWPLKFGDQLRFDSIIRGQYRLADFYECCNDSYEHIKYNK